MHPMSTKVPTTYYLDTRPIDIDRLLTHDSKQYVPAGHTLQNNESPYVKSTSLNKLLKHSLSMSTSPLAGLPCKNYREESIQHSAISEAEKSPSFIVNTRIDNVKGNQLSEHNTFSRQNYSEEDIDDDQIYMKGQLNDEPSLNAQQQLNMVAENDGSIFECSIDEVENHFGIDRPDDYLDYEGKASFHHLVVPKLGPKDGRDTRLVLPIILDGLPAFRVSNRDGLSETFITETEVLTSNGSLVFIDMGKGKLRTFKKLPQRPEENFNSVRHVRKKPNVQSFVPI